MRFLVLLWISSLFHSVYVQTNSCEKQQTKIESIIQKNSAVDVFYFTNDTKKNIQLTWAVENSGVIILVTMTEGDSGPGLMSDIYRSENNGKTFQKITEKLGESVYIRREHGLQRQQNQKELFLICYDISNKDGSIIFVTRDGGVTWLKSIVPFVLSGQLIFHPRQQLSALILTLEEKSHRLYLSVNSGENWKMVHNNVVDFFWSIYDSDPERTFYVLHNPDINSNKSTNQTLVKTTDLGRTWTHIMSNVIRVWAPRGVHTRTIDLEPEISQTTQNPSNVSDQKKDRFLYVSHAFDGVNQSQQLSVSLDGGKSFKPVYIPSIQPERFYSVLEVEDDMAFVHVDAPNDTGYGTLFTSDSTGQVLTESLKHHLYPNHAPVTDFYRVASMRGTYLTTRMNPNRTLYTVISHDRGASWKPLGMPLNVDGACRNEAAPDSGAKPNAGHASANTTRHLSQDSSSVDTNDAWDDWSLRDSPASKICGLQISSQFSIRNRVIASAPLSIPTAPGLILAHGHVATHLKNTPADVFVSTDGGYTWNKALDGPHYCQIANRGGLLVAVPANTLWPDVLRFSTDEGRCWHTIPLRSGVYHADNNDAPAGSTTVKVHLKDANVTSAASNETSEEPETPSPWNETVVFAGLVTEPGGRAMAAAVYGYGTFSQHWRVAIIDFVTNGMVDRTCTPDDYETWTPHSSTEDSHDGCLLGVKQYFKRLKKDALCINDYVLDPLVDSETCPCTQSDFECEYGYYRKVGTLECVKNPNIPLFDPCQLTPKERHTLLHRGGYRRIPGDRCVGGWQPPHWNDTAAPQTHLCPDSVEEVVSERSEHVSSGLVVMCVLTTIVILTVVGFVCYRHSHKHSRYHSGVTGRSHANNGLRSFMCPWIFKDIVSNGGSSLDASGPDAQWPPISQSDRWRFSQLNSNGNGTSNRNFVPGVKAGNLSIPRRTPVRCSFVDHGETPDTDITGLIEAEEVALPEDRFSAAGFLDPLAPPPTSNLDKGM